MKEYKVVSLYEGVLSDKFNNTKLENMLNGYARKGWIVKTVFTDERPGLINVSRKYCVFVLERDVVNQSTKQEVEEEDEQVEQFVKEEEQVEQLIVLEENDRDYNPELFWKCNVCESINSNDEEMCHTCGVVKN